MLVLGRKKGGGGGSSGGRARDSLWGGRGFDSFCGRPLPIGWVGVSIMRPAETWPWSPRSVSSVAARKIVRHQSWDPSAI